MVPGLDYVLLQTDARTEFKLHDGVASSEEVRVEGDLLSLKADGRYDLATKEIDFDVELRFLKNKTFVGELLQTVLLPMSRLFGVRLSGTFSDPKWESVNF